jgi:uncharacterized protein
MVKERPAAVFLGGDLLPRGFSGIRGNVAPPDFVGDFLIPSFTRVRDALGDSYPAIFVIPGNDDPRCLEAGFVDAAAQGTWQYVQGRKVAFKNYCIYGYAFVPPTPYHLKDWERYDVSRYVGPGCVSPEEGRRSVAVAEHEVKWGTIKQDLAIMAGEDDLDCGIFLFHTPPYDTDLDRAALDGKSYEHVLLDLHVGSIAVKRFIDERQPLLTLHGHVHESTRLTGVWKVQIGRTICINAAHDGPELALVRFDPGSPGTATRQLI